MNAFQIKKFQFNKINDLLLRFGWINKEYASGIKNRDICRKKIETKFDHIIVGQGLAGSCLALHLLKQGKKILVFDEPKKNYASAVAAGLFNPVTGKRLARSWMAEKIFPYLFQFYREAEITLGQKFFYPEPIYQPFISIEEQNEWMTRNESRELKNFIENIFTSSRYGSQTNDEFGGVLIHQSGYLDTLLFMESVRSLLKKENAYREIYFDESHLQVFPDKVSYERFESRNIIFCQGLRSLDNPLLSWVPVLPLKGETLSISLSEKPEAIFNRGVYIVPSGNKNEYRVGATYQRGDTTPQVTASAKSELEGKITGLTKIPFKTIGQNWGIRPSTFDRRPILGPHPQYKNVIIFNGLGTKGVSIAPYFSALLSGWLNGQEEIPWEINIERFKALYSKFSFA